MNLFTTDKFKEAWSEWLQYRKERKLPKYTSIGIRKTFTHLFNLANQDEEKAIEIINYSISQNYQGFFTNKTIQNEPKLSRQQQAERDMHNFLKGGTEHPSSF